MSLNEDDKQFIRDVIREALNQERQFILEALDQERLWTKELISDQLGRQEDKLLREFERVNTKYDAMERRLDKYASLFRVGDRSLRMLTEWSEGTDKTIAAWYKEISDLNKRLEKLERRD